MGEIMIRALSRFAAPALALPRAVKRGVVLALDAVLCVLSVWLAFYLRSGSLMPLAGSAIWPAVVSIALALPVFITSGLYRAIFRYSGLPAMVAVGRAMLLYGLAFAAIFTLWGVDGVPRTVGLIQPLLLVLFVGASRAAARVWLGGLYNQQLRKASLPQAVIYGAGNAGRQLASAMANSHDIRVVGFLDDDDRLHGHVLNGLPIHNPVDLAEVLNGTSITDVLLALPSVSRQRRNEILNELKPHKVAVRTRVCAEAAARNGVRNFVLISTDKAVRPTNIMGATKRLAEKVLQALAEVNVAVAAQGGRAPNTKTTFSMVRFGNVLGSSGSVVPLFREQIKNGGPITLTHPDITRYFMTIPEAAQLVIQAGAMGQGGDVFVLDMGQPVKIIDLARRMVELSGLTVRDELNPSGDIELTVTGLRPGEKLYEELLIGDNPKPTQHPRIMKAQEQFLSWPVLEPKLNALSLAMSVNDVPVIRSMLQQIVSGYQPSGEVVDWVHMAQEREALANE